MGALALGQKHRCRPCGRAFYDMGRAPACPRCGAVPKARRLRVVPAASAPPVAVTDPPVPGIYDDDEVFADDADTSVDDDLDDDGSDVEVELALVAEDLDEAPEID